MPTGRGPQCAVDNAEAKDYFTGGSPAHAPLRTAPNELPPLRAATVTRALFDSGKPVEFGLRDRVATTAAMHLWPRMRSPASNHLRHDIAIVIQQPGAARTSVVAAVF